MFQGPWKASGDLIYAGCTINNINLNNSEKTDLKIVQNIHLIAWKRYETRVHNGKEKGVAFSKKTATEYEVNFFHISHRTREASNKKTRGTDSDIYHYHTSCSQASLCEMQRDSELREASQMLDTTNNRQFFHKAEKPKLWKQRLSATYKNRGWLHLSIQMQLQSYTQKRENLGRGAFSFLRAIKHSPSFFNERYEQSASI